MKWLKNLFRKKPSAEDTATATGFVIGFMAAHGYKAVEVTDSFLEDIYKTKLQLAIEREDYEEAARLRDLMNKK